MLSRSQNLRQGCEVRKEGGGIWGEAGKIGRASPGRQRLSFHVTRATGSFEKGRAYHALSKIFTKFPQASGCRVGGEEGLELGLGVAPGALCGAYF